MVSRLLILDIFFSLFFVITYGFAVIWGITFSSSENRVFLFYGMLAILLLNFFYVGGVLIKTLFKYKKSAVTFLLISWFALVFIFPEAGKILRTNDVSQVPSVEKLNLEKLHVLLKAERQGRKYFRETLTQKSKQDPEKLKKIANKLFKNYLNKGYTKNTQNEAVFLQQVKQTIDAFTSRFPFSPIDFLNFVSGEASGKGYTGYLDFLNYTLKLRHQFIQFYGQKRYEVTKSQQRQPESFIKNSENIYQSQGRLPGSFETGAAMITIYTAILLVVLFYLNRKKKVKRESPKIPTDIKRNNMLFLLVNKDKQGHLFETMKQKNYATLDPASQSIIYKELSAGCFINYVCREKKIGKDKVTANLEKLNIREADLQKNLADYTVEDKKKLICSIVFADADSKGRDIIINDFIKGVSNVFEKQFLSLVSREIAAGRIIVYISSHMYSPASSFMKRDMEVKNYQPFQLDPQKISLR
jgi:ABC-type transport system involved in multi-copper enzyme maturation permease subunit